MNKTTFSKYLFRRDVVLGTAAALLLLTGGLVWADKHDKITLKNKQELKDESIEPLSRRSLDPFSDLIQMQREMERLFDSTLNPYIGFPAFDYGFQAVKKQAMDLIESDDSYQVKMELPGMSKQGINIEINGQVLAVSGERSAEKAEEGKTFLIRERETSAFRREVTLPKRVNANAVDATYEDGVLIVTLPKNEKDASGKIIEIK